MKKKKEKPIEEKKVSLWSRVKKWSLTENLRPVVFTAGCCNSMWNFMSDVENSCISMPTVEAIENSLADLLIVHGQVNAKKLVLIKKAYENLGGKKYVLGIGTCLTENNDFVENEIPFDLIIPGCHVNPETIAQAISNLKDIR